MAEFDASDIDYLCTHFSNEQLRIEVRNAYKHLNGENDWKVRYFYDEYITACKLALNILGSYPRVIYKFTQPRESIESIKSRYDLVDYISQYVNLKKAGQRYYGICPFHSEKQPSFVIYANQQTWHCFGACNLGGDLITFVMKYENLTIKDAILKLSR
jgi:hypothetical protein